MQKNSNSDIKNFQRGLLNSPHCKDCRWDCEILYDAHHDQFFGKNCGTVIMEMGEFMVPYNDNLDKIFQEYDERFRKARLRREEKERKLKKRKGLLK